MAQWYEKKKKKSQAKVACSLPMYCTKEQEILKAK